MIILEAFDSFWRRYPALLVAVAVFIGCCAALNGNPILLLPITLILIPLVFPGASAFPHLKMRLLMFGIALAVSFGYVKTSYDFPQIPEGGIQGTAVFDVNALSASSSHIGKKWVYKGTLLNFEPDDGSETVSNIPIRLTIPKTPEIQRPAADCSYRVHGTLLEPSPGNYFLKVAVTEAWHPLPGTWSLAEYRYKAKLSVGEYIRRHFDDPRNAAFLTGIATGEFDDRLMYFEFGRFGLLHIMAISGFHFAIITAILGMILRCLFSMEKTYVMLIFLLSSYFVFLGCSASIMRAWITILIAIVGFLIERRGSALNSLGMALLLVVLYDPFMTQNIGFQFSFAVTAAILMFYATAESLMQKLFIKRHLGQMVKMNFWEQHGYLLLSTFRQAAALAIAVNIVALPMTLFFFNTFPLMGLAYNLFFPFLVSISMLLLILGLLTTVLLPPVGYIIHKVNGAYTAFVLNFTYNAPAGLDFVWTTSELTAEPLIAYLSLVFFGGVFLKYAAVKQKQEQQDFVFI